MAIHGIVKEQMEFGTTGNMGSTENIGNIGKNKDNM